MNELTNENMYHMIESKKIIEASHIQKEVLKNNLDYAHDIFQEANETVKHTQFSSHIFLGIIFLSLIVTYSVFEKQKLEANKIDCIGVKTK